MSWISEAFEHIPEAATSPLALVAYLAAVAAAVVLSFQMARNRSNHRLILALPKAQRDARVRELVGKPLPERFSGEQWLRHKRNQLVLCGIGVLCGTVVIVFAIAAVTVPKPPPPIPVPAKTENPPTPAPPPTATEKDAALLDQFDLKLDRAFVHQLFGAPNWTTSVDVAAQDGQNATTMPIEIYAKAGYNLTIGYDPSGKVSIYSLVPSDEAFLQTAAAQYLPFTKTYQDLAPDAFIANDLSSKFYYYAEGHIGNTEAEGHVTQAYFYTDTGLEPAVRSDVHPPSSETDALSTGDEPPQSEAAKKWRAAAKPNGYLRAREGVDIAGIFFHDMDWRSAVS